MSDSPSDNQARLAEDSSKIVHVLVFPLRMARRILAVIAPGLARMIPAEVWLLGYVMSLIVGVVLLVGSAEWVAGSYFEARAFNRVTGEDVSTWDAMWVELRVLGSPSGVE